MTLVAPTLMIVSLCGTPTTLTVGPSSSYATIADAVAFADTEDSAGGYVIQIEPGTYVIDATSLIEINTLAGPLSIEAMEPGTVEIDGAGAYRCIQSTDVDLHLVGLTLQNGYAVDNGGGLHVSGGSLLLDQSNIEGCTADLSGGGAYLTSLTDCSIIDTTFTNCVSATDGGGVAALWTPLAVTDCQFDACLSIEGNGGGIDCASELLMLDLVTFNACQANRGGGVDQSGGLQASNCTFLANTANDTAGAVCSGWGTEALFEDCLFSGNVAVLDGGGAISQGSEGTLTAHGCTFQSNSAYRGGAIIGWVASATLTHCTFIENDAVADAGGAVYLSADGDGEVPIAIANSLFQRNSAHYQAGALFMYDSSADGYYTATIHDSTFNWNESVNSTAGAIQTNGGAECTVTISQCILRGNVADNEGQAINIPDEDAHVDISDTRACDHAAGDEIGGVWTDDGGNDLGEWCCPGDTDDDSDVDADDITLLLDAWGDSGTGDDREDADRDGDVIMLDLIEVLRHWGACA